MVLRDQQLHLEAGLVGAERERARAERVMR